MNEKELIKEIKALQVDVLNHEAQIAAIAERKLDTNKAVTECSRNVSTALRAYGLKPTKPNTDKVEDAKAALKDAKLHLAMDSESVGLLQSDLVGLQNSVRTKTERLGSIRLAAKRSDMVTELENDFQELCPHLAGMMANLRITSGTPVSQIDLTKWLMSNMPSLKNDAQAEVYRIQAEFKNIGDV